MPVNRCLRIRIRARRAALRALSPSYQVSTCVAWSPDAIDGRAYDVVAFAKASDLLYVMDYDTRSQVYDACIAAERPPSRCIFAEHSMKHTATPIFALQSEYDAWQVVADLGIIVEIVPQFVFGIVLRNLC